jgi:protease II
LAKGFGYFSLGLVKLSRDQRYLAYAFDTEGSEEYVLAV